MSFASSASEPQLTAIIDAWPYTTHEIERAVFSARSLTSDVVIVVPDLLAPYDVDDFPGVPARVLRVPFWGNFTTLRNTVLAEIKTPWEFFLFGNEEFLAADSKTVLSQLDPEHPQVFRMVVATGQAGRVLAEPVRIVPSGQAIQFVGRIWPQVVGSLMEFGYDIQSLDARIYRLEDRRSSSVATRRLREALLDVERVEPRNWRTQLSLAVLSWGEHRYAEVTQRLKAIPHGAPEEAQRLVAGLSALCYLEQGQYEKTLQAAQKALRRHSDRAELWWLGGNALMELGRFDEAATYFHWASRQGEHLIPYLDPGFGTYGARLKKAQCDLKGSKKRQGLADLLTLLAEYPSYRSAWQEVLSHLGTMSPEEVFSTMTTVVPPSKVRRFFTLVSHPTEEEARIRDWLYLHQFH